MKEFKTVSLLCLALIILGIASFAIYDVRSYLPVLGMVIIAVLFIGLLLGLLWLAAFVYRSITRYEFKAIDQYGTISQRYNATAIYQPQLARVAIATSAVVDEDEDIEELPALQAGLLSFRQLMEQGIIQNALAQGKLILGYYAVSHELRYGSWLDLYSCGIGGVSGSGKSTTVRFLLFQAIMASAKFIFVDPHIGNEDESLAAQFKAFAHIHQFAPCDTNVKQVLKRIHWLKEEFAKRKRTGAKTPFLILVIDEFNAVMRVKELKEELSELLLQIEQEARKFGIFAMLIGQRWSAQDIGGADIRTSLASLLAHRFTDEDQARKLVGSRNGPKCLELGVGQWLFRDTQGSLTHMITPETYASDSVLIQQSETTLKPRETSSEFVESTPQIEHETEPILLISSAETTLKARENLSETSTESTQLTELARQIMRMQAQGMTKNEVMRSIWGVNPGGNAAYQEAQIQYQQVMGYIASQIGA